MHEKSPVYVVLVRYCDIGERDGERKRTKIAGRKIHEECACIQVYSVSEATKNVHAMSNTSNRIEMLTKRRLTNASKQEGWDAFKVMLWRAIWVKSRNSTENIEVRGCSSLCKVQIDRSRCSVSVTARLC